MCILSVSAFLCLLVGTAASTPPLALLGGAVVVMSQRGGGGGRAVTMGVRGLRAVPLWTVGPVDTIQT